MQKLKSCLLVLVATLCLVLTPVAAEAQVLTCTPSGTVAGGYLYPGGSSNGGACQFTGIDHIFSWIVCAYVGILNDVLGKTYCGIQYAVTPTLAILLSLYIGIFGLQILMGTAELRAGEIVVRLLKIAGVWMFATQSLYGIGIIFEFFLSLIGDGAAWVINSVMPGAGLTSTNTVPIYDILDGFIYNTVLSLVSNASSKVIGFFAVMFFIYPPIFGMALFWLMTTLATLARTLASFLLGISAVAFLVSLSPIFLSFMLFRLTYHLFESWLRYMTSYSVQIIVSFAIVAMWIAITMQFVGFFNDLGDMVFPYHAVVNPGGAVYDPENTWAICPPQFYLDPNGPEAACTSGFNPVTSTADYNDLIPPSDMQKDAPWFFVYVLYHLLVLCLIGYAFLALLHKAPNIAHDLVGPEQVPVIGQGWGQTTLGEMTQRARGLVGRDSKIGQRGFSAARDAISSFSNQAREQIETLRARKTIK